jgi:hypothetical protein
VSNWDDEAYFENDAWFPPVTYDQTDYHDVDGYLQPEASYQGADAYLGHLAPEASPSQAPGGHGGGRLAYGPGGDSYAGYDDFAHVAPPAPPSPGPQHDHLRSGMSEPARLPGNEPAPPPGAEYDQHGYQVDQRPPQPRPPQPPQPPGEGYHQQGYLVSQPAPPLATDARREQPPPPDEAWMSGLTDPYGIPRPPAVARPPKWLLVGVSVLAAAGLGFGVVMLAHRGHHSLSSSALPTGTTLPRGSTASPRGTAPASPATAAKPPLTQSQAQRVLASYTTTNNTANAQDNQSLLATVESGSSFAIDSGIYDAKRATQATGSPAYGPASASYYIPLEAPATYPHWFAVRVENALLSAPGKVVQTEYLVFTQASAGARWLDSVEPFVLASATTPPVALNASGYATAVPASASSLKLPVATASGATAAAFDSGSGQLANPGNLADRQDMAAFKKSLPSHTSITTAHLASTDPVFGLRTTDGGALLFYDVGARLTLTAPPGSTLRVNIPGFVSTGGKATDLTLSYLEQFATDDPPAGAGTPARVIADYSGLVGSAGN